MITFINISGCPYHVDGDGHGVGFEDDFAKMYKCRAHDAAVGLGADCADRFIR